MPRSSRITKIAPATSMHMSATLKTGQCGSVEEVDDVAPEGPGRAEQPVDQVAGHAGEQQAERRAPSRGGAPAGRDARTTTRGDDGDQRDHRGQRGAGAEGRAGVAEQPQLRAGGRPPPRALDRSARARPGPWCTWSTARATAATVNARAGAERRRGASPGDAPGRRVSGGLARDQRRSSRCLQLRHRVARGKAINRFLPIALPQISHWP